jgi:hypothetical protein
MRKKTEERDFVALDTIDLDELAQLHERLAFSFRMAGLQGHELDLAIVSALFPTLRSIEASRAAKRKTRERIKLVMD